MDALVRPVTWLLGLVFLAVGLLGFVMPSPLLGYFEVDSLHSIIHLASGAVAVVAVLSGKSAARMFLMVFGAVYLAVAMLGYIQGNTVLGLIDVNFADNVLHAAIAAVCLIIGHGSKAR